MQMKTPELVALLLYFAVLLAIGIIFYFKARKAGGGEKTYFLGDRNMNGWVSAFSAGASDMSAWVLMGLPGAIYLSGIGQVWIAVGLFIGTFLAWTVVAPKLRRFSIAADDAITVPQFLTRRFKTDRKGILLASAVVFMVAYCIYAASSISACGTLFNTVLGMDPKIAMIIATVVIAVYTFLGGYNAVCWTDFFQGLIMLGALMLAPILAVAMMKSSGWAAPAGELPEHFYNVYSSGEPDSKSWADIISGLGWGLGYFGMPHILIRYFSVRNEKEMKKSKIIGCIWIFIILGAASLVGLLGRSFFGEALEKAETQDLVFVNMIRDVFEWIGNNTGMVILCIFLAGILLSAILAASMSTADSQLLASSSAFVSDIYKPFFRKNATDKEMMWAGRIIIVIISVVAFLIASNPKCGGIMALVSCAWGAFGAAFGPVILLALFWKRLNYNGALAGIIVGFAVDILWYWKLSSLTGIYEIVPGFIAGLAAAYFVSQLTKAPGSDVLELFEKAKEKTE